MFEKKDFFLGDTAVVTDNGKRISGEIISYAIYGLPQFKQYQFVGILVSQEEVKEFPLENIVKIIPKRGWYSSNTRPN